LIFRKSRLSSQEEFARRQRITLLGLILFVASAEDVIVAKLEWAKLANSPRQIEDVGSYIEAAMARTGLLLRQADKVKSTRRSTSISFHSGSSTSESASGRSSQSFWQGIRQKGESEQFSSNARFVPFRMIPLNSRAGQVTSEQAHLEGEEKALFAGHRALNPQLNLSRCGSGIGDGHGRNVITQAGARFPVTYRVS
jgi:hypothetical protein